ncbi:MAG TPA: hypothetical protein VGC21_18675 [Telluria sp.]|jgi:hypothetical protein
MHGIFLEVIISAEDASSVRLHSRDEIEEALEEALVESGLGEVTGGGGGMGLYVIDMEVEA